MSTAPIVVACAQQMEEQIVISSDSEYDSDSEAEQKQEQPTAEAGLEDANEPSAAALVPVDPAADKLKSTFVPHTLLAPTPLVFG